MNPLLALLRRSMARAAGIVIGLMMVVAGLEVLLVMIASQQQEAQSFELMARIAPAFMQRQFGAALPSLLSFSGLVSFAFFHPVVLLAVALCTTFVATELAADIEGGQSDLMLAQPLARHALVTRSLWLVIVVPTAIAAVMFLTSRLALRALAPADAEWPAAWSSLVMAAHLVAIAWCFGSIGLMLSSVVKRRLNAMGPVAILAVTLYLLEVFAGAWPPIARAAMLSPFHYFQGAAVLAGTADTARDLTVLGAASLVFVTIAYWRFSVRDV